MAFGIHGKKIKLVPYDPDRHLENFYKWMNDPDVVANLCYSGSPLTRASQTEQLEKLTTSKSDVVWAVETLDDRHVGISSIHGIEYPNAIAETGSYIASASDRGKGYGTESSILRARFAFEVLGLRMLKSIHLSTNVASEKMLQRTGYVEYGRLEKGFWKNGEFRDDVFVVLTKERFFELHP